MALAKQFYRGNRKRLWEALTEERCMAILASGHAAVKSADECFPFQVNTNFYYLTGIDQANVYLVLLKDGAERRELLYIDAYGMTVRRVTTSAFMVFLAIVFVSVILRIYIRKINIVKIGLVAAGCPRQRTASLRGSFRAHHTDRTAGCPSRGMRNTSS